MLVFRKNVTETLRFSSNIPQIVDALVAQLPVPAFQVKPTVCQFNTDLALPEDHIEFLKLRARSVFKTEIRSAWCNSVEPDSLTG